MYILHFLNIGSMSVARGRLSNRAKRVTKSSKLVVNNNAVSDEVLEDSVSMSDVRGRVPVVSSRTKRVAKSSKSVVNNNGVSDEVLEDSGMFQYIYLYNNSI
jgi:hypothetical protein